MAMIICGVTEGGVQQPAEAWAHVLPKLLRGKAHEICEGKDGNARHDEEQSNGDLEEPENNRKWNKAEDGGQGQPLRPRLEHRPRKALCLNERNPTFTHPSKKGLKSVGS